MAKTVAQLEKEVNALIKLVMLQMEELAMQPPAQAAEPYAFNDRRRMVVRKIWGLFKECMAHGAGGAVQ